MKQCGAVLHPWLSYSVRALLLKLWFCDVRRHGFERSEVINLLLLRMPTVKTHTMTNKNNLLAAGCDWIELNLPTTKSGAIKPKWYRNREKGEDNDFCVKYFLFRWTTTSLCIKIMKANVIHVFLLSFWSNILSLQCIHPYYQILLNLSFLLSSPFHLSF